MDASKEIAEITEAMAIFTAIATFGSGWKDVSDEDLDHRARAIQHRLADVLRRRENERNLYA